MELNENTLQSDQLETLLKKRQAEAESVCWEEIKSSLDKHKCRLSATMIFKDGKQKTVLTVEYTG